MKRFLFALLGLVLLPACTDSLTPGGLEEVPAVDYKANGTPRVRTDRTYFRDEFNRYVYLAGINVGGTNKLPVTPAPDEDPRQEPISFVGRPFPIGEADYWLDRLKFEWGFNTIRLVILWEAIEHEGRGIYDQEYLEYVEQLVSKCNDRGIYVLLNFHENLFSRYLYSNFNRDPEVGQPGSIEYMLSSLFPRSDDLSFDSRVGGDGAPRWAVEACLPEKDIDSVHWGMNKLLGRLSKKLDNGFWFFQILGFVNTILNDPLISGISMDDPKAPKPEDTEETMPLEEYVLMIIDKMEAADHPATPFEPHESCDVLPLTNWWNNVLLSYDVERCYAAFYAGDAVFPSYTFDVDGKTVSIKEYFQEAYKNSWLEVAKRVKKYPNVIGYDLVNEPPGGYLALAAAAIYYGSDFNLGAVENLLTGLVGEQLGAAVYRLIFSLNLIPLVPPRDYFIAEYIKKNMGKYNGYKTANPDKCIPNQKESNGTPKFPSDSDLHALCAKGASKIEDPCLVKLCPKLATNTLDFAAERATVDACLIEVCFNNEFYSNFIEQTKETYRMNDMNLGGVLSLNIDFTSLLVNLYDLVGTAIQEEDPNAIIWLEEGGGALDSLGLGTANMWKPAGIKNIVYTPHWYPDIYPYLGFNEPPRYFDVEEWILRDFTPDIQAKLDAVKGNFGPVPVVFGEFGTYYNYNNWQWSVDNNYRISAEILDNYYETFEKFFTPNMLWCFSADNQWRKGDLWNFEDFSIWGADDKGNQRTRGELAWARPRPWALSGKPIEMHFYSDYHYYDPDKGTPDAKREFYLKFGSKESDKPTEIYVPKIQYSEGFYVWLSDGWATFDHEKNTLHFYPTKDQPGWEHSVTIRPPLEGAETVGWSYFFDYQGRKVQGDHK